MLRKITSVLPFVLISCAIVLFLCAPARYAQSVLNGFSLWVTAVLPTTFPFLFLTGLLVNSPVYSRLSAKLSRPMGALFGVSGAGGGVILLSALSGYPVGARTLNELVLSGTIEKDEIVRLAPLCSTSGPMFLIGTVGCMLYRNALSGVILLISHLAAVYLTGLCSRLFFRTAPRRTVLKPHVSDRADVMFSAVSAVLCVGGFIAVFSCFSQMLSDLGLFRFAPFGTYSEGIFQGILEMTTGCNTLSRIQTPLSLACSCALVTLGGACVLAQQFSFLSKTGMKLLPFLLAKCIQTALAFLLCFALATLFHIF